MSIKKIIIFILISFFAELCFGQKVTWGLENKSKTAMYTPKIIGEDDFYFYCAALDKKKYLVEKYDKKIMKIRYSVEIILPEVNGSIPVIECVAFFSGKFIIIGSVYDKKAKLFKINAYTCGADDGKLSEKSIEIMNFEVKKKSWDQEFNLFMSSDKNKLLLTSKGSNNNKSIEERYFLFNTELNLIVKREETLDENEKNNITYKHYVDNEGSIYFLKPYGEFAFYVASYDANQNYKKWGKKIDLSGLSNDVVISDMTFSLDTVNNIFVTAFYKEGKKDATEGCFYAKIDNNTKDVTDTKLNRFDKDFIKKFYPDKKVKKLDESSIYNEFKNISVFPTHDSGLIITGEKYSRIINRGEGKNYSISENFDNLIVLKIAHDGELGWTQWIPKWQNSTNEVNPKKPKTFYNPENEYYSYLSFINNGNIYTIFNDHIKNTSKNDEQKHKVLSDSKKSEPVKYTINIENGEKMKEPLLKFQSLSIPIKPTNYYQNNQQSEIIIFKQKGKKYHFGKISFN